MINRTFDNDETFVARFLDYWEEYRSIPAGREESLLKKMVYYHNTLYPDFAMSECMNCGSRWKKAEDRLDLAYNILKAEQKEIEVQIQEEEFFNDPIIEEPVEKPVKKNKK